MKPKILIAYASHSGSTAEMAQVIGQELSLAGAQVDVKSVKSACNPGEYQAAIVGAPMIMGWHTDAAKFVKQYQTILKNLPVAFFLTGLSLIKSGNGQGNGIPVYLDPTFAKLPKNEAKLSFKEKYALVPHYLKSIMDNAPDLRPVSVGFFNGKLDTTKLDLFSRAFVSLVIGAHSGDFRNWEAVRTWAANLAPLLIGNQVH
ncbi:MAG: hypothetical protein JW908_13380 [Anaerolineales bacterium]|nr:hypothetical protein [Anaerolineales bacterium]